MEQQGMSEAQIDQAMSIAGAMLTPTGIVVTSLVSGIIVGFVISLIVSAVTKESDPRAVV